METLRLGKAVRSVVVLERDTSGGVSPTVLYKRGAKRKRGTFGVRHVDKFIRRTTDAQRVFLDDYLKRHNKSNKKRRNGWVRDYYFNMARAGEKAYKKVSPRRWL